MDEVRFCHNDWRVSGDACWEGGVYRVETLKSTKCHIQVLGWTWITQAWEWLQGNERTRSCNFSYSRYLQCESSWVNKNQNFWTKNFWTKIKIFEQKYFEQKIKISSEANNRIQSLQQVFHKVQYKIFKLLGMWRNRKTCS